MSPHGTNARYQHESCRCARCRKAHADAQRTATNARSSALVRLSQEYPDKFQALLTEEKRRYGVRAVGRPRRAS